MMIICFSLENFKMRITGNMVNYFFVCKRKLWLFQHQIGFEQTSERVMLGRLLDKTSYHGRGLHHVMIDNLIDIDMVENWQLIHEVKKSNALEPAAVWQLIVGSTMRSVTLFMNSSSANGTGLTAPIPPVLRPVSPSPIRL